MPRGERGLCHVEVGDLADEVLVQQHVEALDVAVHEGGLQRMHEGDPSGTLAREPPMSQGDVSVCTSTRACLIYSDDDAAAAAAADGMGATTVTGCGCTGAVGC